MKKISSEDAALLERLQRDLDAASAAVAANNTAENRNAKRVAWNALNEESGRVSPQKTFAVHHRAGARQHAERKAEQQERELLASRRKKYSK